MTLRTINRTQQYTTYSRIFLFLVMLCWTSAGFAQAHSDLLVVVDEDGVSYTAQQTLFANDELIVIRLPSERTTLMSVFSGSGSAVYRHAHEKDPEMLTLVSGSVFTRYRHRFSSPENTENTENTDIDLFEPTLRQATLSDFEVTMARTQALKFSVTWILPANIELLSFYADDTAAPNPAQRWQRNEQRVMFEQTGSAPSKLTLEYRVHSSSNSRADACVASLGPSEWCSPDTDNDGVPDYRDICVAKASDPVLENDVPATILSDNNTVRTPGGTGNPSGRKLSLGCGDDSLIVLPQIQFASGQTYLNAQARSTLDKVAVALKRIPDKLFRVATHTDNAGYIHNNQTLSDSRADAIRHYLMLRGLGPNQIQARGYGETSPAHDNRTAEGRRANRRVELQLLN
ncbi:MAG: OmpA family protein [Granulosicoccus sp.]